MSIAQMIRDDIVSGVLPFGHRLTFDDLSERYGTSHMPIREALRELQGEGLVVGEPNRGSRVRTVDQHFVGNIFDIRNALEVALTRRVASRACSKLSGQLEDIEDRFEACVGRGDYIAALLANREFHQTIYNAAENPEAVELIARHWFLISALWRAYGYGSERFSSVISDHRYLIRAISEGDADTAAAIMAAHVVKAKQELLDRMDEVEKTTGSTQKRMLVE